MSGCLQICKPSKQLDRVLSNILRYLKTVFNAGQMGTNLSFSAAREKVINVSRVLKLVASVTAYRRKSLYRGIFFLK